MTRINCVSPKELHHKHLVAEYRELPRIFGLAFNAMKRGEKPTDSRNPTSYVLGAGHVRFFYPRLGYLRQRFFELVCEMQIRGFKPIHLAPPHVGLSTDWFTDWVPDEKAVALNRERISQRMPK